MRVVICGGGVIGAAIAYFLSRRGVKAIVVEHTGLACAASGKSGGFLALDWCDGTPLEALARRSFALHAQLSQEIPGTWGYRRLTTYSGFAGGDAATVTGTIAGRPRRRHGIAWLSADIVVDRCLGSTDTTAQVHPGELTAALMRAAQARGAELRLGRATGVMRHSNGARVTGVAVDGQLLEGDAVVIAMGPWSVLAARWLRLPAVYGLKGHSLVFETGTQIPAEALFLESQDADGRVHAPEVFPRSDGTTYVCAISSDSPLPMNPQDVAPDPGAIERLHAMCARLSPALAQAKVLARQACYRPIASDGVPLLGRIPRLENAYLATGHSVWGILNAPATGEAIAELIIDQVARGIDVSPFDPGRLAPLDPRRLGDEAAMGL
jgi:glycine/D-amino acid oxidase-like deaminating enzyme